MATNDTPTGLSGELGHAVDELQAALQRATAAASQIRDLLPRINAVGGLFDELESVIRTGRQQLGVTGQQQPIAYSRPTLVVPGAAAAPPPAPIIEAATEDIATEEPQPAPAPAGDELICFRLEFESRPGPLDLRAVDDAVGEHPAVRDVALLDYDGRKATLKVWIIATASPSDVQSALSQRAAEIFSPENDVTIVALEDVA